MGSRCVDSFLRMIAATTFLAVSPYAWAQRGTRAEPSIWCSKEKDKDAACSRWGALYSVTMRDGTIKIDYLDTDFSLDGSGFSFFEGWIRSARVKRTIIGKIAGAGSVAGVATGGAGRMKIDGTLTKKEPGGKEKIVAFEGEMTEITLNGTVKATIRGRGKETGESVDGPFEGVFQEPIKEWDISGIHTPPPAKCSFAGASLKPLRREEARELWRSRLAELTRGRSSLRTELGNWRTDTQKKAKEARLRKDRSGSKPLEAKAENIARFDRRPLGKFGRRVKGTMNFAKDKITLELPALPVLTDKCTVERIVPAGTLELVKQ